MAHGRQSDGPLSLAQATLGWAALCVVLLAAIPLGANRPVSWTLLSLAILILFSLQCLIGLARPPAVALRRAVPVASMYLAVLIWGYVQIAWPAPSTLAHPAWSIAPEGALPRIGADPGQGGHILMRLAAYGMVAWILAASSLNSIRAWKFVRAIALFSTCLAVYGLWTALTGHNPVLDIATGRPTFVSATFVNRNSYATYAAFGLFANIAVYMSITNRGQSDDARVALRNFLENFFGAAWIYAIGILLCATAVALTTSRAGGGAAVLGLIVMMASTRTQTSQGSVALWVVLLSIVGFVAFAFSSQTITRLFAEQEQLRFIIFEEIYARILERPWLGQGIGAFHDTFRQYLPLDAAAAEWDMAHNSYLENTYELGIPASVLLYTALTLIALRIRYGLQVRDSDKALPALGLACFITAAAHSLFDFSLQMPATAALFAAVLGLSWSQSWGRKERLTNRASTKPID